MTAHSHAAREQTPHDQILRERTQREQVLREQILREPWPTVASQREGVTFGMWIFLATEVLFFGAVLLTYAVYRDLYPAAFRAAAAETDIVYGGINTVLLLTSSFVMTIAVEASGQGLRRLTLGALTITALLGVAFLTVKGLEYREDILKHLLPGPDLPVHLPMAQLFFSLYWFLTGVHAIHLAIGVAVVVLTIVMLVRNQIVPESTFILAVALYWHFVDTVWVILFALIYLPGRA